MRVVIDLQSIQAPAYRERGIGRYSLALARALAQAPREHELYLLLNGAFGDAAEDVRVSFADLLPPERIKVWHGLRDTAAVYPANHWRQQASELLREDYIASLEPDVVLVTNLFQGFGDATIVSINRHRRDTMTACISYDLIPLIYPDDYLRDPTHRNWYHERLDHLRRADLVLAISESSRDEVIALCGFDPDQVVNISSAIEPELFKPMPSAASSDDALLTQRGIRRPFVLYTGAEDERKNLRGFIRSFALLPLALRRSTMAVIACRLPEVLQVELLKLAHESGLEPGSLVLTGYVTDEELLALYRRCHLFVFPSWHEGFGLPVLEAMACGAPSIASNVSSLPEVIGWAKALFDPHDDADIARAINLGLTNKSFRVALTKHALKQSAKFRWDATAERAWDAMEQLFASRPKPASHSTNGLSRPRLAFVSPMPPEHTGIADYSAALLPMLSRHYDIDLIVAQSPSPELSFAASHVRIRDVAWFQDHARDFTRIVYQFGNSPFHSHMLELLERFPGIVVLHDFYLSALISNATWVEDQTGLLERSLHLSHSWKPLQAMRDGMTREEVTYAYPCNLAVVQAARGVIVHSEYSRVLASTWYGAGAGDDWEVIPLVRTIDSATGRQRARMELGLDESRFVVCSFGALDWTKYNQELISAWLQSALASDTSCELILVGEVPNSPYGTELRRMLLDKRAAGRVRLTGRVSPATYRSYLAATDVAVQLRRRSRGETSAAVLDCMSCGIPTIVNASGSLAELPGNACLMLPDVFTLAELADAMTELHNLPDTRKRLGRAAAEHLRINHTPRHCADCYVTAIEAFVRRADAGAGGLVQRAARLGLPEEGRDLMVLAQRANELLNNRVNRSRQLLVDISAIVQQDLQSGIQRVVRSILRELLASPPPGFRVEPIYAKPGQSYCYAADYTAGLLELQTTALLDEPVDVAAGDVYLCLDWAPQIAFEQRDWLDEIRLRGVATYFYVYDLLPVLRPEFFPDYVGGITSRWLGVVARADGVVCDSRYVATTVQRWLSSFAGDRARDYQVGWAHLGADIAHKSTDRRSASRALEAMLSARASFLMVGTIEPRKGHLQAIAAFERLWMNGVDVNLVLAGKLGFQAGLRDRLDRHPEMERRLFWLQELNDEGLEQAYRASRCLIAASADEGFGLPLIEAARHGLPIIARDIPVFREVAGENAFYFDGDSPQSLAAAIQSWIELDTAGQAPGSSGLQWLTWKQSADRLMEIVLDGQWQFRWKPERDESLVSRILGSDYRVQSAVGERHREGVRSKGLEGYLIYGPYVQAGRGRYVARLHGVIGVGGAGQAVADVTVRGGATVLYECHLGLAGQSDPTTLAVMPFTLDSDATDLECRVRVTDSSDVRIDLIEIHKDVGGWQAAQATATIQKWQVGGRGFRLWATHPSLHSAVGNRVDRTIWTSTQAGHILYGPYCTVRAGSYRASVFGEVNVKDSLGNSMMDLSANSGKLTFGWKRIADQVSVSDELVTIDFELTEFVDDFEIRVWADHGADFRITGVELRPTDEGVSAPEIELSADDVPRTVLSDA